MGPQLGRPEFELSLLGRKVSAQPDPQSPGRAGPLCKPAHRSKQKGRCRFVPRKKKLLLFEGLFDRNLKKVEVNLGVQSSSNELI